jgi:asparagine synthase (glutamine-hydrolysing)
MSGVFGLLDPRGAVPHGLEAAAGRAGFRGRPVLWADGPIALGTYVRDGQDAELHVTGDGVLVADGRIDAPAPAGGTASQLHHLLRHTGKGGLATLAADFALAYWEPSRGELTLARDAFGLRPLVWARRGSRVAFASDPEVLIALGLASGELDPETICAYLAMRDFGGERTGFEGIHRLLGGRWRSFDVAGRSREGRWFRPEDIEQEETGSAKKAAEALQEALVAAAASRSRGRRTAVLLSGGRDSGAVAVALARAGISATCITHTFREDLGCSEEEPARRLAEEMGHRWIGLPAPMRITPADLADLPAAAGTPLAFPAFPQARSLRDAVAATGAEVVLDGEGGEPLFTAGPVAVLDLLRRGRLGAAARAARGFHERWIYPYPVVAKAIARALMPPGVFTLRERIRGQPPWVAARPPSRSSGPGRTSRRELIKALLAAAGSPFPELWQRTFARTGVEYASPLLDTRVVRVALSLPVELRVPTPTPKPLLSRAMLEGFEESRRKIAFTAYYDLLSASVRRDFPHLVASSGLAAGEGYVRRERLVRVGETRWKLAALPLTAVENWLRRAAA